MNRKIVYIAHPVSDDVERNLDLIKEIIRSININNPSVIPFAHYWVELHALDDSNPEHRQRGLSNDIELIERVVDEMWLFGHNISDGMLLEIEAAQRKGIPVRVKDERIEQMWHDINIHRLSIRNYRQFT